MLDIAISEEALENRSILLTQAPFFALSRG